MRIRLSIPDRHVDESVLNAALEATSLAATKQIAAGEAPTIDDAIRRGVRWKPEPFRDGEHFDLPAVVAARGWGDCDDLSAATVGTYRATGQDPGARAVVVRTGPDRWHAVVRLSDGRIVDPSRWAGMPTRSPGVRGAIAGPMACAGDGAIAAIRDGAGFAARCDLPMGNSAAHVASVGRHKRVEEAIRQAVVGAILATEEYCPQHATLAGVVADELVDLDAERLVIGDLLSTGVSFAKSLRDEYRKGSRGRDDPWWRGQFWVSDKDKARFEKERDARLAKKEREAMERDRQRASVLEGPVQYAMPSYRATISRPRRGAVVVRF